MVRAQDSRGQPVILKFPAHPIPDYQKMASYRQERDWFNQLHRESAECLEVGGQSYLIRPDCGGETLAGLWLNQQQVQLLFEQALHLLENLARVKLVHGEIHPNHLIWSDAGGLKLVGWGAAAGRSHEQGPLRYKAPEQTGRLRRGPDERTDLYCLGVCLWQQLAGQRPYPSLSERLELTHAVLALELPDLKTLRPEVPDRLNAIIARLTAKDPDRRFANVASVRAALNGQEPLRNASARLIRPAAQQLLEDCLKQVKLGGQMAMMVSGDSGIGKTTLLNQVSQDWLVYPELRIGRGRHIRHTASSLNQGLAAALNEVVGQILAGPAAELERWKLRIQQVLAPYSDLLPALVPNLEHCLSSRSTQAGESSVRIRMAVSTLVSLLASPERPLVLLIDDLDQADLDSTNLLSFVTSDPSIQGFLLVATHRPDACALSGSGDLRHLSLQPFGVAEVEEWLALNQLSAAPGLADQLRRKAQGNPFLLQTILHRIQGDWQRLAEVEVDANSSNLLVTSGTMPRELEEMLATAACLGEAFCVNDLAEFLGCPQATLEEQLGMALQSELVERTGNSTYRFAHPRIQAAAYDSQSEPEKIRRHLRWGRLLGLRSQATLLQRVEHLRLGVPAMTDPAEQVEFAELALGAASQMCHTGAFERAFQVLKVARECSRAAWSTRYGLCLAVLHEYNRVGLILGQHQLVREGLAEVWMHARSLVDEAPAWLLKIRLLMAEGQVNQAYEAAQIFLTRAGRQIRFKQGVLSLGWCIVQTQWVLRGRSPESLLDLPETTDPLLCAIQEVQTLSALLQARASPETIPQGILRDVRCVVQDGLTAYGAQCWTGYASLLCHGLGQVELAQRFADLALKQVQRLQRPDMWPRVAFLANMLVYPWVARLAEMRLNIEKIIEQGLAWGDTLVAFLAELVANVLDLASGLPLPELEQRLGKTRARMQHHCHQDGLKELMVLQASVDCLQRGPVPARPPTPAVQQDPLQSASAYFRLLPALVFGQDEFALELVLQTWRTLSSPVSGPLPLLYWTYAGVALYRAVETGRVQRQEVESQIKRAHKVVARWAAHVPEREWRSQWLGAARLRCQGASSQLTLDAYEQALQAARLHGQRQDAALIAEEMASYLHLLRRHGRAEELKTQAVALYRQWGAHFKANLLEGQPAPSSLAGPVHSLDLQTVLKASQALSGEIHLPALLRRLVNLALENAGGQRGFLLLPQEQGWSLAVKTRAGEPPQLVEEPLDLEADHPDLATSLLRYTLQTRQLLIADQPFLRAGFAQDQYLQSNRPGSVLCLALQHGSSLVGLLYLENALATGAFDHERVEVLRTLSGQMAISLQNARHFEQIQRQHQQILEEALRRQSLESRKDALAAVLGIASHDLKNPLAVIQMWMAQLGPDPGTERLQQVRRNVETACHRASSLIATYLDVAALEQGRMLELQRATAALDCLIETEIEFLLDTLPPAQKSQVALQWELEPLTAWVDAERIRQLVGNLVGNALKYCPLGTEVLVTLSPLAAGWQLEVIDQGPGLPAESQARLFQPFERRSRGIQGSGLGLWICRVVVEAHGGELGLDSPWEGQGCRFWCRIPHGSQPVG